MNFHQKFASSPSTELVEENEEESIITFICEITSV